MKHLYEIYGEGDARCVCTASARTTADRRLLQIASAWPGRRFELRDAEGGALVKWVLVNAGGPRA